MNSDEPLVAAIKAAASERNGRVVLSCSRAFEIAGKFSADLGKIGAICNENGIKIVHCQLGCFK